MDQLPRGKTSEMHVRDQYRWREWILEQYAKSTVYPTYNVAVNGWQDPVLSDETLDARYAAWLAEQ